MVSSPYSADLAVGVLLAPVAEGGMSPTQRVRHLSEARSADARAGRAAHRRRRQAQAPAVGVDVTRHSEHPACRHAASGVSSSARGLETQRWMQNQTLCSATFIAGTYMVNCLENDI